MKKHLTVSNLIFGIVIFLMLYKPSRVWFIRQMSFSPSIEKIESSPKISNYNWELQGLNMKDVNFSEFEGKVVFLNFWATWCPPCVAELPYIQEFYKAYKDKVVFISITNENWTEVAAFFKKRGYDFPVYQSNQNYLQDFPAVTSIPRTFLIDKQGYIRVDKSGSADWNSASFRNEVDELLK